MAHAQQKSASELRQQCQELACEADDDDDVSGGATSSASQARSSTTSLLSPPSSSLAVKHGPFLLTDKRIQAFETKRLRELLPISYLSTRPTTGCGARSTSLWVHRNLVWQRSRDGNLHGLGVSHAMTASLKPSFRAPWRVGDSVVGSGNAEWTTSKR